MRWATLGFALCGLAAAVGAESAARVHAPRSGPAGATLFTRLAPEQTGVVTTNRYDDPRMWWERYLEFTVGAIGTGVAVGDYDGDGRPDLFVTDKTGPHRLFRNLGDWRFEEVAAQAGLTARETWWEEAAAGVRRWWAGSTATAPAPAPGWNNGATWADVDNDGDLDLYVCRYGLPNQLWINRGDGTFREGAAAAGLDLNDASGMAAFADYDRDGWLDVFVQTNLLDAATAPRGQRDRLYRNRGDGTFADVTEAAGLRGETQGHAAIWWDHDEDGWPDLYLANDFSAPDRLWRNRGDGTFEDVLDAIVPRTPFSAMGADLGDVDNDGRIDLLVADMAATTVGKDLRGMADSRAQVTSEPGDPAVAPQDLRNALYLNRGAGRMVEAARLAGLDATDWTWSVRWEDLDNDGRLDLFVTNGMVRELHNADLIARTMVTESPAARIRLMKESPVLAEANLAYRNRGDLRFEETGAAWGLDQRGVSFAAACGDLDGDGDLDWVVSNYGEGVTLLRNDGADGNRVTLALRGTVSNRFGVGAVVTLRSASGRQVRTLVLARGYMAMSEPMLHFGLGSDSVVEEVEVRWPSGRVQRLTGLAVNHHHTLVEPKESPPAEAPRTIRGWTDQAEAWGLAMVVDDPLRTEEPAAALRPWRLNRAGPRLAVGDVGGEGRLDLVLGGSARTAARLVRNLGGGRFVASDLAWPEEEAELNDGPLALVDANADGRPDILITRAGVGAPAGDAAFQPRLWLNRGAGRLQPAPAGALPVWRQSAGALVVEDFDRDGFPDVFLGARMAAGRWPEAARSALWRGGAAGWTDATTEWAPAGGDLGLVTAAVAADFDGDGWLDLAVAAEWGRIRVWRNLAGRGWQESTEVWGFDAAGTGWWRVLAAADLNGDGRADLVAGNAGSNTPYRASAEEPVVAWWGDFGGRRGPTWIEAQWEAGELRPRAPLRTLAAVLPELARRIRRHDDYARMRIEDVVGAPRLAAARQWQATELRSGVLVSAAGDRWRFAALPWPAQVAPIMAATLADLDGDGRTDLLVGHNDHAPVPVLGRFGGGLGGWLRGDGAGGLTWVDAAAGGVVVPGEVRDAVLADLDGDDRPEWIVARGDAPLMVFKTP